MLVSLVSTVVVVKFLFLIIKKPPRCVNDWVMLRHWHVVLDVNTPVAVHVEGHVT